MKYSELTLTRGKYGIRSKTKVIVGNQVAFRLISYVKIVHMVWVMISVKDIFL